MTLRASKTHAKSEFTKHQRRLLNDLGNGESHFEQIQEDFEALEAAYERAMAIMSDLLGVYDALHDTTSKAKLLSEVEELEKQLSKTADRFFLFLDTVESVRAGSASHGYYTELMSEHELYTSMPTSHGPRTALPSTQLPRIQDQYNASGSGVLLSSQAQLQQALAAAGSIDESPALSNTWHGVE